MMMIQTKHVFGMIAVFSFLTIALQSIAEDQIVEIKKIHDRLSQNVAMKFNSVATDTFQYDTYDIEEFTGLKRKVTRGENHDQVTPDDVDEWYKTISSKDRSYRMSFDFHAKGRTIRTIIHAPEKTFRLWETSEEYIVNEEQNVVFLVNHKEKSIHLFSIQKDPSPLQYVFFNPILQSYPLAFIDDINSIKMEKQGDFLEISWENPDANSKIDILSIHSLLDPANNFVAIKTLVKVWKSPLSDQYFLSEQEQFISKEGIILPQKMILLQFFQFHPDVPSQEIERMNVLKSNVDLTFDNINTSTIKNFDRRYILQLDVDSISTEPIIDSVFWPIVPTGYTFADARYITPEFYRLDSQEQKRIDSIAGGVGPHDFPVSID